MPYVEAKSQIVKELFRDAEVQVVGRYADMVPGSIYLFTYSGKRTTQRRPLIYCLGQKVTKQEKKIVEGINLNYLTNSQARALEGSISIFDSLGPDDVIDMVGKTGDYKKYPLETTYRTYSSEKISSIQKLQIV